MKSNNKKAMPKTAAFLRERREAKGLSLREVGDRVGLTYTHICRIELGDRRVPLDKLDDFAKALDIPAMELRAMAMTEDLVPMERLRLAEAILKGLGIGKMFDPHLIKVNK